MFLVDATDTLCSNYTETIQWRRAAATSCFLLRTGIHHIVATSFDTLRQPLATSPHKNRYIWSFWAVSKRPARISPPLVALNDSCFCTHSTMSNDSTLTNGGRARTVRETQTQNGDKKRRACNTHNCVSPVLGRLSLSAAAPPRCFVVNTADEL